MDLKSFADTFVQNRRLIAFGVVAMSIVSLVGVTRLGFDDNPRSVFRTDDEEFQLLEEIFEQFGADENNCFLIARASDLFSPESIADLRALVGELQEVEGLASVSSLTDRRLMHWKPLPHPILPRIDSASKAAFDRARRNAMKHPIVAGQLLSSDGNHTLITVRLRGDELPISEIQPVYQQLRDIAQRYSKESTLDVHVTGIPGIRVEAFDLVQAESMRFTILCSIASFVMAIVILRRAAMVVVETVAPLIAAIWAVGTLGLIGEQITVLTVVLPMLVMVVAFTDSIHLVVDVRHSRVNGLSPKQAARDALQHLTVACGLTSFTTAVGFASLVVSQTEIIRRFGLACAMGSVLGFLAVISIVPLLSSSRIGRGMLPPHGGRQFDGIVAAAGTRFIDLVLRHRWIIVICGVTLFTAMSISVLQLRPENQIVENLPDNSESVQTLRLVDEQFGGMLPALVVVDWPQGLTVSSPEFRAALQDVHRVCEQDVAVNHPFSILNLMQSVPRRSLSLVPVEVRQRLVRGDLRRAIVINRSTLRGSAFYSLAYPALAKRLRELEDKHQGFRFRLTGSSVVASRNLGQMITDLASSLVLASVVIFITMTLVFRSLRIGLICLIPNALPLLLTASVLVWTGESLRFAGVIVFCVCLGIAVDDTIHVVNRFQRELREVGDVEEALRRSLKAVGAALIITTMVLLVGFSITLTSDIPGHRMFGRLSIIAIAAALLGDLVLLPAMLACFVKTRPMREF